MSIRPVVLLAVAGCAGLVASAQAPSPAVDFQRDIQPIFKQYCPGNPHWLCRPGYLSATDLTFAFEPG